MDAEDVVVDERREREAVEGRVDALPDERAELRAEAVLALPEEAPVAVVLLPAVDVARLVVAPQEPDLGRLEALEREEVRDDLEAAEAPVDVVACDARRRRCVLPVDASRNAPRDAGTRRGRRATPRSATRRASRCGR